MLNTKVYTEGKNASMEFSSTPELCENPYPKNTPEWKDWNFGWNSDMSHAPSLFPKSGPCTASYPWAHSQPMEGSTQGTLQALPA